MEIKYFNKEKIILMLKQNIYKDPAYQLLNAFPNIENVLKNNDISTKYFYFIKDEINELLYNKYAIINIEYKNWEDNKSFYFYLDLLIENSDCINYVYSLDVITKNINFNDNNLINIIKAKILFDLLDNFKGFEINSKEDEKEVEKIEVKLDIILKENINYLISINESMNLNYVRTTKIDEIFIDIIISLIKSDKLSNYEYTENIIKSLNFEEIELNKFMIDKLSEILNSDGDYEPYIKEYKISDVIDLYQYKNINFHYILLHDIIKNPIYIFQFRFLIENRKIIIKNIKNSNLYFQKIPNDILNNKGLLERIKYVIETYAYCDYYTNRLNFENNYENKNLNDESEFKGRDSTRYIKTNKMMNNNYNANMVINIKEEENIEKLILFYSNFSMHTNKKGEEPFIIFDKITVKKHDINIIEQFFSIIKNKKDIRDKNFEKFLEYFEDFKKNLKEEFKNEFCLKLKLKFEIDKEQPMNEESFYNISCLFTFYDPINNREEEFLEHNILKNKVELERTGIYYLFEKINDENYKNIKYILPSNDSNNNMNSNSITNKINENKIISIKNDNNNINEVKNNNAILSEISEDDINSNGNPEEIIVYKKIIGKHKHGIEGIKEIAYDIYMTYGGDNFVRIYNESKELKLEIKIEDKIYNISSKKNNDENYVDLIGCCGKNIYLISINIRDFIYEIKQYQIPDVFCFFHCEMENDTHIISNLFSVEAYQQLFTYEKSNNNRTYYTREHFHSGLKINEYQLILVSNSLYSKEDNLIIINIRTKKVEKKFKNYSYVNGSNGLSLINIDGDEIILAACKKYFPEQKNGIFLYQNNSLNKEKFYDTEFFEVNCIWPLNFDNKNKKEKYFFSGGFDPEIGEGKLALYQIKYNHERHFYYIEFLQNIEFVQDEQFHGFDSGITSICQGSNDGNLLVGCLDGNVYLFSKPNLRFYSEDEININL